MALNSSRTTEKQTLAERDVLAVTELANLRDEPEAFERFHERWPRLADLSDCPNDLHPVHDTPLPPKFWSIYERREKLRGIWESDEENALREFLLPPDPPPLELSDELRIGFIWDSPIVFDWRRGEIIYQPRTDFQRAIYALFRKSIMARVCGNPDCPARYFVARKATQRYCSDICAEVFQKAWKKKWWAEHGDQWRRGRKKSKRSPKSKR
jgi:hypothetical protein